LNRFLYDLFLPVRLLDGLPVYVRACLPACRMCVCVHKRRKYTYPRQWENGEARMPKHAQRRRRRRRRQAIKKERMDEKTSREQEKNRGPAKNANNATNAKGISDLPTLKCKYKVRDAFQRKGKNIPSAIFI